MANKTVLILNNKEDEKYGIVLPVDENTVQITWDEDITETLSFEDFDQLMENPNFELTEEVVEENAAQDSIKAHASADVKAGNEADNNPKTRYEMIRNILGNLADMDMTSLVKYFNDQQAMVGGEAERAGTDKAAYNQSTIKMHPSAAMEGVDIKLDKEHQDAIFGESTLSEEAREKISTLFEAAVSAKVVNEVTKLQEMYETKIKEHIEEITTELTEDIDTYLNHVANEWLKENEVAIESSLRLEMFNDFMEGLHALMTEHYIDLPEEKVDVLEKVVEENEKLAQRIDEEINRSIELEKTIAEMQKSNIVLNMSEGLTMIQKDKLKKLTEKVDFANEEDFKKSVQVIKEGFLKEKNSDSNILNESLEDNNNNNTENNVKSTDPRVNRISDVLSKF